MINQDATEMQIIAVSKSDIPDGYKLVEAYESDTEIIVLGIPEDGVKANGDEKHNCDEMGCLWEHILYRFSKSEG